MEWATTYWSLLQHSPGHMEMKQVATWSAVGQSIVGANTATDLNGNHQPLKSDCYKFEKVWIVAQAAAD